MTLIIKATIKDVELLSSLAVCTFIESHGNSAGPEDIVGYTAGAYDPVILEKELNNVANLYYLIYYKSQPAGYAKMINDVPCQGIAESNLTKLERIYLLKEYYSLHIGQELLHFLIDVSIQHGQTGMWLYVWKDNPRTVAFYKRNGFTAIGSHDFPISPTHSNPNWRMLKRY